METLSTEQKSKIIDYLDVSSLINLADTSTVFRNIITDNRFLEKQCRRRFGLSLDQLPSLVPCEKLLIDSQRLVFRGTDPVFPEGNESLMKLYAMEMRSSWYPFAFLEPYVGQNVTMRNLQYPWSYDSGDQSGFYGETKKFAARFHAAFPFMFGAFLRCVQLAERQEPNLAYYYGDYSAMVTLDPGHLGLVMLERLPRVVELRTNPGRSVHFFLYDDDGTWRAVFQGTTSLISLVAVQDAPLEVMRGVMEPFMQHICREIIQNPTNSTDCPSYLALETTRHDFHRNQVEFIEVLSKVICSAAANLGTKLLSVEADRGRRDLIFKKLIKFVDGLFPCADVGHSRCEKHRKPPSKKLNIALNRALRRLANDAFVSEVKRLYDNPTTFQMVHTWSWMGHGRGNQIQCFAGIHSSKQSHDMCNMKIAMKLACCHVGYPELWPAITLKKAIDQMPDFVKSLEEKVMEFVSRIQH